MKARTKLAIQLVFLLAALVFIVFRPVRLIVVDGKSMMPTYHNRQLVWAVYPYDLKRNDVVVLREPTGDKIIKRIVMLEGDCYRESESLMPDGTYELNYEYGIQITHQANASYTVNNVTVAIEREVPKNCVYVLGDNRQHSSDSREFGPVNRAAILYKVL
jgi:signal peptidase I